MAINIITYSDGDHLPASKINEIQNCIYENEININKKAGEIIVIDGVIKGEIFNNYEDDGVYIIRNVASGSSSHAEGGNTTASGDSSHSEGNSTTASGLYSHAEGIYTIASGENSHTEGSVTTSIGENSHAEGSNTNSIGVNSHAEGYSTNATGNNSHSSGLYTISKYCQTVIGSYNIESSATNTTYDATKEAFIIGNGSYAGRSNAFKVLFNGNTYIPNGGAYNATGADYAEFFEWKDQNINNEDRVGYFVTIDGNKIEKANSSSNYILGVVSGTAGVIGDNYEDAWQGKYEVDEFGRIMYEMVEVPDQYQTITIPAKYEYKINEETYKSEKILVSKEHTEQKLIQEAHEELRMKISANWDSNTQYIPRKNRPEWACVGTLGKIFIRDDGTCQVNGYCMPNDNGIATNSTSGGYRVLERVNESTIRIWFK